MITLRSVLFNVAFFSITTLLTLVATVARLLDPDLALRVAMLWARTLVAAARLFCGIRLSVTGLENIPPGAALIASRHESAFDTFVWLTLLPRCCYVLKQELLRIPLFGGLLEATGMIAVDREAGGAAIRALLRGGDRAVREVRQIVIFPEGTRSEPDKPGNLQSGVAALSARTGLPVIPVFTDSGRCWGRRAFHKRPGTIHIAIGKPIPAGTDRKALMRFLEQQFAGADDPSPD
jgi:1-acyl-sn-glycerol-3-phosphate acyltransferase